MGDALPDGFRLKRSSCCPPPAGAVAAPTACALTWAFANRVESLRDRAAALGRWLLEPADRNTPTIIDAAKTTTTASAGPIADTDSCIEHPDQEVFDARGDA